MKKNKINVLTHLPRKIKIVMIFVCVICLVTLGFLVINKFNAKQVITTNAEGYVRTITLSKSSLDETVSATGNIESQDTSSVSTNLEYAVKEIYVQVGDTVEEGDIICKLDTSEIEKKIEKAKETQSTSKETLQTNYDNAVNAKETAWTSFSTQRDLVSSLNSIYQNALSAFQVAESSVNTQQSLFNSADSTLQSMGLQLNSAESSCLASGHLSDCSDDTSTTEYTAYQSAKQNYDNAKNNYDTAKQNLENAKTNSNYQNLYTAMTTAKNNLDSANAQLTKYQETFSSADAKVSETYKSLNNSSTSSSELEDLYEQLEDCTLTAKSSGKVTSLNATVGSKVNGSVATIQNTNSLKIVVSVDEYDIQKIKEGLTARITSDAVDEELTGIVSQISPVATAGSQGTSSGFQVEIDVTSSNSSLLIGMSAKVEILISSVNDVFTVPLDAIETKEDGTSIIYVRNDTGEFIETAVTVGEKTDYYAEISGSNLSEGMVVRASANEEEATVTNNQQTNIQDKGGMGGSFTITDSAGGAMPEGQPGGPRQ